MATYFKDKKFNLIYLDHVDGIKIADVPNLIREYETGKSSVVAARASSMSKEGYLTEKLSVRFKEGAPEVSKEFKEIFEYICLQNLDDIKKFIALNPICEEHILVFLNSCSNITVRNLLLLVESDGTPLADINKTEWSCCEVREGGPELVVDFLLSKFCHHTLTDYFHKDDPLKKNCSIDKFDFFLMNDEEKAQYEEVLRYNFSNHSDFTDLVEYEEDSGEDGAPYKCSYLFYYYSVNLKALTRLKNRINVPSRVKKLLTEKQTLELEAQVPAILIEELDYIAQSVLMQKVDNYKNDAAMRHQLQQEAQWGSDMYDILGGDGEGNVYLGDGLSLDSSGRLVDD